MLQIFGPKYLQIFKDSDIIEDRKNRILKYILEDFERFKNSKGVWVEDERAIEAKPYCNLKSDIFGSFKNNLKSSIIKSSKCPKFGLKCSQVFKGLDIRENRKNIQIYIGRLKDLKNSKIKVSRWKSHRVKNCKRPRIKESRSSKSHDWKATDSSITLFSPFFFFHFFRLFRSVRRRNRRWAWESKRVYTLDRW